MKLLPILLLCTTTVHAEWTSVEVEGAEVTATDNASGQVLVYACKSETECTYRMTLGQDCVSGSEHNVLLVTDKKSLAVTALCNGSGALILDTSGVLSEVLDAGDRVAIAIPSAGVRFRVYRFDLTGSKAARLATESRILKTIKHVSEEWL